MVSSKILVALILLIPRIYCLENFIRQHFSDETLVVITSNYDVLDDNLNFLSRQNRPKIMANPEIPELTITQFKNYILVVIDLDSLLSFVDDLPYKLNTRGNILIIFEKNSTEDELKSTFETLWGYYIYNVVIHANWTDFVTWYPYSATNLCGTTVNLVRNRDDPFADKIPPDLGGCSINVTWNTVSPTVKDPFDGSDPGYAVKVLDTIAEKMNITVSYLSNNLDYFALGIKTGTFYHLTVDMKSRRIDAALTMGNVGDRWGKEIETEQPLYLYNQNLVLPPRKQVRHGDKILSVFSTAIWCSVLASMGAMALLWMTATGTDLSGTVFYVVQLTVQNVVRRPPRERVARVIFLLFLACSANLNWCYLSKLSSVLTRPSYEPKIRKISDLVKSDKKLKFYKFFENYLRSYGKEICDNLMSRRGSDGDRMVDFAVETDYGTIMGEPEVAQYKNAEALEVIYTSIVRVGVNWSVRRGFPLLDRFNAWTLRMVESGLVVKWFRDALSTVPKQLIPDQDDEKIVALNVDHVCAALVFLLVGLSISLACFVAEVLFGGWPKPPLGFVE